MPTSSPPRIGCLVMAAGNAQRFGENKLSAHFHGATLIERTLNAIPPELFFAVTVVTQYEQIEQLAAVHGFAAIHNAQPELGVGHTIRLGTEAMSACDGILYLVADQPMLSMNSIRQIVEAWKKTPQQIVGASHGGKHGNPNLFPARFFPALMALEGDRGGNRVIMANPDAFVPVELPALELADCDTPQALADLTAAVKA